MAGKLALWARKGLYFFADGADSSNPSNGTKVVDGDTGAILGTKTAMAAPATIATTGNTDCVVVAPFTGTLASVDFSGTDALAANNSNYITFSITNLGQDGTGTNPMLAATDANTTKSTGGTALAANTKRSLTLNGTSANLAVTAGDRLLIRAAATGTLAGTVTFPAYCLRFTATA